jgi:hypothetical protein
MIKYLPRGFFPCHIGICFDAKSFDKEMSLHNVKKQDFLASDHASATLHYFEGKNSLICIMCIDKTGLKNHCPIEIAGLCAHEALHVWQQVKIYVGEKEPGAETEAYFLQHTMQFFMDETLKAKKSKS